MKLNHVLGIHLSVLSVMKSLSIHILDWLPVGDFDVSDFTEEEVKLMTEVGATPVGLGPCRLRVETATIALLATLMLWSDSKPPHL